MNDAELEKTCAAQQAEIDRLLRENKRLRRSVLGDKVCMIVALLAVGLLAHFALEFINVHYDQVDALLTTIQKLETRP